jgi:hypothetical protein
MKQIIQFLLVTVVATYIILAYYHSKSVDIRAKQLREDVPFQRVGHDYSRQAETAPRLTVLYCIASSSFNRIDVLQILLDNAVDWCEGGYDVSVMIDTWDNTVDLEVISVELKAQHVCNKGHLSVEIFLHERVIDHVPVNLAVHHRLHFRSHLSDFDIFMFSEDDMSIRLSALNKWHYESQKLGRASRENMIGLVRYENSRVARRDASSRKAVLKLEPQYRWDVSSPKNATVTVPRSRVTWEFEVSSLYLTNSTRFPLLKEVDIPDRHYLAFDHKKHFRVPPFSAAGIYLRNQLDELEKKCLFLSEHKAEAFYRPLKIYLTEFYGSSQPFQCGSKELIFESGNFNLTSPEFNCCKQWLLPVDGFSTLFIHHIGTPGLKADNKWSNRHHLGSEESVSDWTLQIEQKLREGSYT